MLAAVDKEWRYVVRRVAAGKLLIAFVDAPTVVCAADARQLKIDLFPALIADIANVHVAGRAVEAESPRVAQAVRPDFVARVGVADKGIVWRNCVGRVSIHIKTQNGAEQDVAALPGAQRVALWSAIT